MPSDLAPGALRSIPGCHTYCGGPRDRWEGDDSEGNERIDAPLPVPKKGM